MDRNMIGIGLLSKQRSPTGGPKQNIALSEKYAVRTTQRVGDNENSRKNLKQREILSSAESSNHFITKTRVGGTLKNSR